MKTQFTKEDVGNGDIQTKQNKQNKEKNYIHSTSSKIIKINR